MPQLMQVEIMDPEEAQRLLESKRAENEAKERARLAAANRLAGHPEPKPGDRMYVSPARGLKMRSRARCHFTDAARSTVVVVADTDPTGPILDGDKPTGNYTVHADGAELILADDALTVTYKDADAFDAAESRRQIASRDQEIERLKAENARILREARMGAKDSGDGAPSRLAAQRKAKAGLPDPEFGGKD